MSIGGKMKRIISVLLTVVICISSFSVIVSAERDISKEEALAQELKELGLFKGVSDTDFDLDRAPTRVEALVMLIRVLGRESEVTGGVWRHPFTDVPEWADKYVGFAYSNGLTNGQSLTEFGTGDASAAMFVTFVLRALGYSDTNGADFVWNDPFTLARTVGILPDNVNLEEFWRADVVTVAYSSLVAHLKGTEQTLAEKLITAGVFTRKNFYSYYSAAGSGDNIGLPAVELPAEEIYASCSPAVFYIEIYDEQDMAIASGSGFFIDDKGTAVTNFHVIEDAYSAKAQLSGDGAIYDIVGVYDFDIENDWAIIKVDCTGNEYLKVGDVSTIVGAATVYTIGSPLGLQNTIAVGIISNPARVENGVTYIQTSAAISSGSSGGALINKYGEVIGITSGGYLFGQNLNLAVPMTALEGYSVGKLTKFKDFESLVLQKLSVMRQETAYDLLKTFILENYTGTRGGRKEFQIIYEMSISEEFFVGFNYNDVDEKIQICIDYYVDGELAYAFDTNLERINRYGYFYYYDFTHSTAYDYYTYGDGNIPFASFNKDFDYKFQTYTGTTDRLERDQRISKELYCLALEFVNDLFSDYISSEYSVADFGYTSFDAFDFPFTEILVEEKVQINAYNSLRDFILKNYNGVEASHGYKSYSETAVSDDGMATVGVYYDEEREYIVANITCYYEDALLSLYIDFLSGYTDTYVDYYCYVEGVDVLLEGSLVLEKSKFNADYPYKFDEYEGDSDVREENEILAAFLHCQLLDFVNYIFEDLIQRNYSVYDLGYTTFDISDFE